MNITKSSGSHTISICNFALKILSRWEKISEKLEGQNFLTHTHCILSAAEYPYYFVSLTAETVKTRRPDAWPSTIEWIVCSPTMSVFQFWWQTFFVDKLAHVARLHMTHQTMLQYKVSAAYEARSPQRKRWRSTYWYACCRTQIFQKKLHRHFWRQQERLCGPATTRLLVVNINERDFWRQFLHVLNHKCSSHQLTENRFCR